MSSPRKKSLTALVLKASILEGDPVPVERIDERDVDLLLAEELEVNSKFADHIKSMFKFSGEPALVADCRVSKSNNLGESDLEVVYQRSEGSHGRESNSAPRTRRWPRPR